MWQPTLARIISISPFIAPSPLPARDQLEQGAKLVRSVLVSWLPAVLGFSAVFSLPWLRPFLKPKRWAYPSPRSWIFHQRPETRSFTNGTTILHDFTRWKLDRDKDSLLGSIDPAKLYKLTKFCANVKGGKYLESCHKILYFDFRPQQGPAVGLLRGIPQRASASWVADGITAAIAVGCIVGLYSILRPGSIKVVKKVFRNDP